MDSKALCALAHSIYQTIDEDTKDFQEQRAVLEIVAVLMNLKNRAGVLEEMREFTQATEKGKKGVS